MWSEFADTLIALSVCVVLVVTMRWVFRPSRPRTGRLVDAADARELGLLSVLIMAAPRTQATEQRDRLLAAGIRASLSHRQDGRIDLLVFTGDLDRARAVLFDA